MNWVLRVLLAVICGVLATAVLNWTGVLNTTINALIGVLVALVVYFNSPGV